MAAASILITVPRPAKAQIFGGIVHDPINYALQVEKRIEDTATDLGPPGYDHRYGYGLVNAARAIDPNGQPPPPGG